MTIREKAKAKTTLSELFNDRNPLKTEDVINKVLRITDVDIVEYEEDVVKDKEVVHQVTRYAVVLFEQTPSMFYSCGQVLTDMFSDLIEEYGKEELNKLLKTDDGRLEVKLTLKKSKNSNNEYVSVEVI